MEILLILMGAILYFLIDTKGDSDTEKNYEYIDLDQELEAKA